MHASFILSGLCFAASVFAQAVSEGIAPTATAPAGCKPTFAGNFTLNVLDISFGVKKASGAQILASAVTVTLKEGILHDSLGRTGAIVENHQFQFDGPPQAGSIYTGGWSACANDSLALGDTTIFYACTSGEFRNLYDEHIGDQCSPINIIIVPVSGTTSSSSITSAPAPSATPSNSASDSKSEIVTDIKSASNSTTSSFSSLKTVTGRVVVTPTASITTDLLEATTGSSTGSLLASAAAASTPSVSTGGAAVATLGAARDFLGAAVGAFGAAFIML